MAQAVTTHFAAVTVADLLRHMGDVPAERVRLRPEPGTATEQDVLDIHAREKRLCELVDGVLVEKTMGSFESYLAALLLQFLGNFVRQHDLGIVLGADGMLRLAPGLVRIPDVSFISWQQQPLQIMKPGSVAPLHPDLAVEVLSPGNTQQEMQKKLHHYFESGAQLVWYVDPVGRTVEAYTSPEQVHQINESEVLTGGDLLPGFQLPLAELFAGLDKAR